ncbi:hypothetical protein [Synechococcus sp. M16CYN]|uniref:hypothetical protein n=1 Tax=Synechococcus sp. M16CYN TaxID=3103139 RepID=UPI00324E3D14
MATIGWLVIGTNRYLSLALSCLESIQAHYSGALHSRFILFTDRPQVCSHSWVEVIDVPHEPFPGISLQRYHHFYRHANRLVDCDYLFYVDADMAFVDVGDEILGRRVVVTHPAFVNTQSVDCPFDRNPACRAQIPIEYQGPYFQNCFQGGERTDFLRMSRRLARRIRADLRSGVMPLWHDESHMNRYMLEYPPTRMLHPGYAYPEWWRGFSYPRRIISVKKNNQVLRAD